MREPYDRSRVIVERRVHVGCSGVEQERKTGDMGDWRVIVRVGGWGRGEVVGRLEPKVVNELHGVLEDGGVVNRTLRSGGGTGAGGGTGTGGARSR